MITAVNNGRMKKLVQLNQKAKVRKETDTFVAEGRKMFLEAPVSKIREVYISESFLSMSERAAEAGKAEQVMWISLREKLKQCGYEIVSDEVFQKISDTRTPQGILCVVEQFHYSLDKLLEEERQLWVLLEDLQDPGNLGTIMRTGEGAGITGVILTKESVDLYNPKTIRATMGSIYRVPFLYVDSIEQAVQKLQGEGVLVYAAHLEESRDYDTFDFTKKTAFLIGNEGNGLKRKTADLADAYLKIPMLGRVESLNAAVATSILMYEASRQRRTGV
ncbi:MAG: RNA methyltransferase [Clostridiales bacterium]|nr:RNA methyltransferase [Clostridiales bacterium]